MPEEALVNFAKFLRTPLLQINPFLNNEATGIDCIFIALAKITERKGSISPSSILSPILWGSARLLVTGIGLI